MGRCSHKNYCRYYSKIDSCCNEFEGDNCGTKREIDEEVYCKSVPCLKH